MTDDPQFSAGEADWIRSRLDSLTEAAADNRARIGAHEAVCAERYGALLKAQVAVQGMLRWMVGSMVMMVLFEVGKASLPDLLRVLALH